MMRYSIMLTKSDDPEVVVVEIEHHGHSRVLDAPYRFRGLGVIRVRDGLIVSYSTTTTWTDRDGRPRGPHLRPNRSPHTTMIRSRIRAAQLPFSRRQTAVVLLLLHSVPAPPGRGRPRLADRRAAQGTRGRAGDGQPARRAPRWRARGAVVSVFLAPPPQDRAVVGVGDLAAHMIGPTTEFAEQLVELCQAVLGVLSRETRRSQELLTNLRETADLDASTRGPRRQEPVDGRRIARRRAGPPGYRHGPSWPCSRSRRGWPAPVAKPSKARRDTLELGRDCESP